MADLRLRGRDRRGITCPLPDNRRRRGSGGGAACAHECGRPSEGGSWRLDKPCAPPGPHPLRQFGPCRHVAILGLRCSIRRGATAEVGPARPGCPHRGLLHVDRHRAPPSIVFSAPHCASGRPTESHPIFVLLPVGGALTAAADRAGRHGRPAVRRAPSPRTATTAARSDGAGRRSRDGPRGRRHRTPDPRACT